MTFKSLNKYRTRNILDCDQSNYSSSLFSPVFLQRCSVIHESGSDDSLRIYGHSKFSKMAGGVMLGKCGTVCPTIAVDRLFMKLFKTFNIEIARECQKNWF